MPFIFGKPESEPTGFRAKNLPAMTLDLNFLQLYAYLEGQGDLVTRLIMGITKVITWVIGVTNLLTKSP